MVYWIAHKILSSPSFSWSFLTSPHISHLLVLNSTIVVEHKVKSSLPISPCHDQELTPSTAYTVYCIIRWSTVSRTQRVSHLSADHDVLNSLHSSSYELTNEWSHSSCCASLLNNCLQIDRLLVFHQSHSITASKCITNLDQSQPPSISLNSHDHGHQVNHKFLSITFPMCIYILAPLRPPRLNDHSLQVQLQTRSITGFKCIYKLASLRPPSSNDHGLQVHLQSRLMTFSKYIPKLAWSRPPRLNYHGPQVQLQTRSIAASKCISKLAWLRPPNSHNDGLQVHLKTRSVTASKYIFRSNNGHREIQV